MSELLIRYQEVVNNPPQAGMVLRTLSGRLAELTIQVDGDKPPFVFGRVYISEIMNKDLGWYLREADDDNQMGWRCVLMSKARREALTRCEIIDESIMIRALRVVRLSESGKSLLCEVEEYGCSESC